MIVSFTSLQCEKQQITSRTLSKNAALVILVSTVDLFQKVNF